ncbi:MAG: glutamate--tRNA ligase [Candidatus Paceibacterota bacterium]
MSDTTQPVVTRIAPSPTGEMHIGTVRTALFNYLFAKKHGGTYFVRIEDTDKERNKEEWVDAIWRDFEWCGLMPDKRSRTSEHLDRHRELLRGLVEKDTAYVSSEPAKDDPERTVELVRLRNPGKELTFDDLVRGPITFDTTELGDFVIARSIDDPLYHFAVVADDGDEGVTHVLRAEEHISNTPRQILIQEALGFPRPVYGHLPLILAPDRSKLSKRKHGASIENYRSQGFLPTAIINYLALLGWNPGTDQEIFSLTELIDVFSIDGVQKGGAVFDVQKLEWFNKEYLLKLDSHEYQHMVRNALPMEIAELPQFDEERLQRLLPVIRERVHTMKEVAEAAQAGEYDFAFAAPHPDADLLKWKKDATAADAIPRLQRAAEILHEADFSSAETVKDALWPYAEEIGRGELLWPLRVSLTGRKESPDPFVCAFIIGREETLARIEKACDTIGR